MIWIKSYRGTRFVKSGVFIFVYSILLKILGYKKRISVIQSWYIGSKEEITIIHTCKEYFKHVKQLRHIMRKGGKPQSQ